MILAKEAFEFFDQHHKSFEANIVSSQFIKFLNKIRTSIDNRQPLTVSQFQDIEQDFTNLEGSEEEQDAREDN